MSASHRPKPLFTTILGTLALALPSVARAAPQSGFSTDIELLRPTFSYGSIPGLDTADIAEEGQIRMGLVAQYERSPLTLWEFDNELGAIVSNRAAMQLGVSWDFFERAGARLTLPVAWNFATDIPSLAADTVGLGDAGLGLRFLAIKTGGFKLGARADIMIPTGVPKNAWIGESDIRPVVGALVSQDVGRFRAMLDSNVTIRSTVDTSQDFKLGSELAITPGVLYKIRPELLNVYGEGFIRGGFDNFFGGGAENPVETVVGVQLYPKDNILVDVGGGKGWNQGYGTTDFRIFAGVTYTFVKKEEPPVIVAEPTVELYEIPPENVEELVQEVKVWEEGQLARVEEGKIVIRDPIQFYLDTEQVLPESLPTLRYVAKLMNGKGEIVHLMVEGHASEEGSYEYNYDLSNRRARTIWEELIKAGVSPDRLSYRGMGEVVPIAMGEDESSLSANRRVEFHIIKQLGPLDPVPAYPSDILLPWNGQHAKVNQAPVGTGVTPKEPERKILEVPDAGDFEGGDEGAAPEPESKGTMETGAPRELPKDDGATPPPTDDSTNGRELPKPDDQGN